MSKYLVSTLEVYRVDTEVEVEALINSAKADSNWELTKYNCEHKERKQQGEVIDDWYKVQMLKSFNNEKEPERNISISYEV